MPASLWALRLGGCSKSPSGPVRRRSAEAAAVAFRLHRFPRRLTVAADGSKAGATRTLPAVMPPGPEQTCGWKSRAGIGPGQSVRDDRRIDGATTTSRCYRPGQTITGRISRTATRLTEGADAGCFVGTERPARSWRARPRPSRFRMSLANCGLLAAAAPTGSGNYYTAYDLTVRTESGFRSGFSGSTAKPLTGTLPVFVKAATKLFPQRFGDENQRREGHSRNGNRHDRGPDMAYDPARRRGGGTGEHHRFARRLPDRNQRGGRGTEPRRLTENETIKN